MGATWIVRALKGERALQVANHTCPGETRSPEVPRAAVAGLTLPPEGGRLGQASWARAREESAGRSAALLTSG